MGGPQKQGTLLYNSIIYILVNTLYTQFLILFAGHETKLLV